MIQIVGKNKARLIVNIGSGKTRVRKTKTVTFRGKRELQKLYDEFEIEVKKEPFLSISVTALVKSYINKRKLFGVKPTTIQGYEACLKRILADFSDVSAVSLTTYQLENYIAENAKNGGSEGYSTKTLANTLSLISAAYKDAIRLGQLEHNPCENVILPKNNKKEIVVFSEGELIRFLTVLDAERIDFIVGYKLCLLCGMRRSEVLGLTENDIDIKNRIISISHTRHRVNGKTIDQNTKTKTSRRTLAIPNAITGDIKRLLAEHANADFETSKYIIQDGFGKPVNPSTFTNHIYKIERENGLPLVSVHGLRHTYASMLNSEGIDIARISAELGHSSINTTLSIYTHVFGNISASSKGIANAIDSKFGNIATNMPQQAK